MGAWLTIATAANARRVEASSVSPQVPELTRTCALGSYDAVHVATKRQLPEEPDVD